MMANFYGISAGAFLGLVVRPVWSQISREMAKIRVQERLRNYEAGEVVFREGETADRFYLVKSGRLRGSKAMNDEPFELKEGSVLGLLGTLQGTPHFSTVEAVEPTVLYEMSLDELMEAAGDKQAPVRVVLSDMADTIRHLVEKP
jgi:CRP-like cAMP-binding protein